jgi:hypothetical protein
MFVLLYKLCSQSIWMDRHTVGAIAQDITRVSRYAAVLSGANILRDSAALLDNLVLYNSWFSE